MAVTATSPNAPGEGVTLTQYRTLVVLDSRGPQRATELDAELGITREGGQARIMRLTVDVFNPPVIETS